ncbi:MAG: MBL fold metallo-hydrolase [Gammaproteobacteria bacterium]|nr:MBL fold metallo-hydrolase [Gammaproteobacteria bacterium]
MSATLTRRAWLAGAVSAAAAARGLTALAQPPSAGGLDVAELTERVAVISGAGANVTVVRTPAGLALVDAGSPERTADLLELLSRRWPGVPVREVFNTNWRPEHTGANAALRESGARIRAHENTRLWMGAEFDVQWAGYRHERRAPAALPTDTFYDSGSVDLGGVTLRWGHLPRAHTDGDIYVAVPDDDVVVASDLLAVEGWPVVDFETGGWIGGMVEATRALLGAAGSATRIVPAAGGAVTREALETQLDLCTAAMEQVAETYRAGGTLEDFLAAEPLAAFEGVRGDPKSFLVLVYQGAYYHVRQLGGII